MAGLPAEAGSPYIRPIDPGNLSPRYVPGSIGSRGCVLTYRVSDQGEALIRGLRPAAKPGSGNGPPARLDLFLDLAELRLQLLEPFHKT